MAGCKTLRCCKDVVKLTDRNNYRLRVGRYRVFFVILSTGDINVIVVEEVAKRDSRTY